MRRLVLAGLLAAGLCACPELAQAAPASEATAQANTKAAAPAPELSHFAITDVEVHVGDGRVIQNGIVVVKDGKILAVGDQSIVAKHAGIATISLSGKLLTPGLIASDARVGLEEIGAESSTVDKSADVHGPIRAGYDPSTAINATSSLIRVQAIEGVTSAAVSPTGGVVSGQVTWIDLVHGDFEGIVAKAKIAVDASLGQRVGGSRAATLSTLRRALLDARFYRRNQRNVDRGQSRDLVAHPDDLSGLFALLDGKVPLTLDANRAGDILTALALAVEFKLELVIVGGAEAWKVADQIAKAKARVILMPSQNLPRSFDHIGARIDNAALLHKAGVEIVIAELGEPHNVRNLKQEAGIAAANGLDHEAAIQAITLNVARAYGMDKDYGSIEAGKVANFVIWDHDPLELDSFAEQVYIRGKKIPMVSRQTLLRDRYLKRMRSTP